MTGPIHPDEALRLVLESAAPLAPTELPLADALGLALAEPVIADRDQPPFPRAVMDGYAVRLADAGGEPALRGEAAPGRPWPGVLADGEAIEITTGAPCPAGCEAVAQHEIVERLDATRVRLPGELKPGMNIQPRGAECREGAEALAAGERITPLVTGALAMFGRARVRVIPRPRIAIVNTGDELVAHDATPGAAQIRDSNGPMLAALARAAGLAVASIERVADRPELFESALTRAASGAEIVLATGAVSAGKYDTVPRALAALGAETVFHGVAQRPGKPLLFARRGATLFFGLPGNPLSCHLGFHRYARAAARRMAGLATDDSPAELRGRLTHPWRAGGPRTIFQLARAGRDPTGHGWLVTPLVGRGSADLFAPARANALLRFEGDACELPADAKVGFTWLDASI